MFIILFSRAVALVRLCRLSYSQPEALKGALGCTSSVRKALKAATPFVPGAGVNCYLLTVIFDDFALARQCSNKFGIALA